MVWEGTAMLDSRFSILEAGDEDSIWKLLSVYLFNLSRFQSTSSYQTCLRTREKSYFLWSEAFIFHSPAAAQGLPQRWGSPEVPPLSQPSSQNTPFFSCLPPWTTHAEGPPLCCASQPRARKFERKKVPSPQASSSGICLGG